MLTCVAVGFVALKFLLHIHFSYFGFGFYLAVVICAALVYVVLKTRDGGSVLKAS